MQGWTATTRHGVTRKKAQKRLQDTENLCCTSDGASVNSGAKTDLMTVVYSRAIDDKNSVLSYQSKKL